LTKEIIQNQKDKLSEIQSILNDGIKNEISDNIKSLDKKIHDPKHYGDILHKAVKHNIANHPGDLSEELYETVESGLTRSVQTNPEKITSIIAPIIGPAIRKSVAETMKSFIESTNQVMEASLSPTSLKWRLQSYISGKSYSDIVLANTVEYRVDYLFLINKKSGILIEHMTSDSNLRLDKDEDLVTGMLTAIRDFSKDVFDSNTANSKTNSLNKLELGNQTIIIEDGAHAYIAAVIVGMPPRSLNITMKEIIEKINIELSKSDDLDNISQQQKGSIDSYLQQGLITKEIESNKTKDKSKPSSNLIAYGVLASVLIFLLVSGGMFIWDKYTKFQLTKKTESYIKKLNDQPGVLITNHIIHSDNKITVFGLKDNFATTPKPSSKKIEKNIQFLWKPYLSTEKTILTKRIASQLNLPKNIQLTFSDGELHISGDTSKKTQAKLIDTVNFYLDNTQIKFSKSGKTKENGG